MAKKDSKVKKEKENEKVPFDEVQEEKVLKEPGMKAKIWKPTVEGDMKFGKLLKVFDAPYGKMMSLSTIEEGTILIPVSTFLQDIDFEQYIGRNLSFRFEGVAGKRDCKMFKVVLLIS